jgi:hypothetical protein
MKLRFQNRKPFGFYPAPPTMAELEAHDKEERKRQVAQHEAYLDEPVTRRELEEQLRQLREQMFDRITNLEERLRFGPL